MNGVISVGQFCEVHGPCLVFCTQPVPINETEEVKVDEIESTERDSCEACTSIGRGHALVSRSDGIAYVSTQVPRRRELYQLLRQACVRSLSCEVGTGKDGGTVYFGDAERGHVLSHTFRIADAHARGFHRWLTIVFFMRDKVYLFTCWPFFIEHIQTLVSHLQTEADKVSAQEQLATSQRAARLQAGRASIGAPRSLARLCAIPSVWGIVHMHLTWLLHAAPRSLVEISSTHHELDLPLVLNVSTQSSTDADLACAQKEGQKSQTEPNMCLRNIVSNLPKDAFQALCYCVVMGMQVVVRGDETEGKRVLSTLRTLLPTSLNVKMQSHCEEYVTADQCNLLSVGTHVALPKPSADVYRIEMLSSGWVTKWESNIPEKYPTLVTNITKAIGDTRLQSLALAAHSQSIVLHWYNTAKTVFWAGGIDKLGNSALLRSLGVSTEDFPLIRKWNNWPH